MDLTREAAAVAEQVRLVETVLLDRLQEQAIADQARADPKATPPAAVRWLEDGPPGGALIAGRPVSGRKGQFQLIDAGAAQVLQDSGHLEVRQSLQLPAGQRPQVAAELRATARELQRAADTLDPPTRRQPAKRAKPKRQEV